jgi:hypothetical protein
MKKLWDSSEIQEAALLFDDLLREPAAVKIPEPPVFMPGPVKEKGRKVYRGDRLEEALVSMCKRGEFSGSVLADDSGLPLAIYNSPVQGEVLAAFTSVLGKSLSESSRLLNQPNANNISMDINYMDKIVLRKFFVAEKPYFLMIISSQQVDERSELELSINYISTILSEK